MSVRNTEPACLTGSEGELLSIHIFAPWRDLESVLEALARVDFPINPEITHGQPLTEIAIPVFSNQVGEVRGALSGNGLSHCRMEVRSFLRELTAAASR